MRGDGQRKGKGRRGEGRGRARTIQALEITILFEISYAPILLQPDSREMEALIHGSPLHSFGRIVMVLVVHSE